MYSEREGEPKRRKEMENGVVDEVSYS